MQGPRGRLDQARRVGAGRPIPVFIEEAQPAAVEQVSAGARVVCFGHMGDGNMHYNITAAGRRRYGGVSSRSTGRMNKVVLRASCVKPRAARCRPSTASAS